MLKHLVQAAHDVDGFLRDLPNFRDEARDLEEYLKQRYRIC
jgi:hypothetical protein